jgi:hypothetical protein
LVILSKIKNWFVGETARTVYVFVFTGSVQYLFDKFFGFVFLFKKIFNNKKIDTDVIFQKLQNDYSPPLSYLNFKVEIKNIKGD